jgi:coatomer subunit delta
MSNIIDDLETIRILQRLVIEKCKSGLSEKEIVENAFELLLIFDDVVSFGYRESVTQ